MQLKGPTFSTYIITAYQCVYLRTTVETMFLQRERYLKQYNLLGYPRKHFISDITSFISSILDANNRIIFAADVNKYIVDRKLAKRLRKIGLTNSFFRKFNTAGPASHALGSAPIDRVWSTNNIILSAVSILSHKFGAGDHRVILVDFEID